jgi:replicative DNA helicase
MSDEFLRKVPPHNGDAEYSILGAVLIDNKQYDAVAEVIDVDDFYSEHHRVIWNAIRILAVAKSPIDVVTLTNVLGGKEALERIGGASYLAECASTVPAPSMAVHYAKMVREKAIQRGLITFGAEIASQAYEAPAPWSPEFTDELLACAEYGVAQVAAKQIRKPEPGKSESLSAAIWNIEHGVDNGVPTGFASLDRNFGGFDAGHLSMLAARTSKGKTAFATNLALNATKSGSSVAYFTGEMSTSEMWLRALGREAQVDIFRARRNGYRDGERDRIAAARKLLEQIPLQVLYRPSMRPREFRLECRRLAREMNGLKFAIIDYLGMMRGDRHERDRWREMQEVVMTLKDVASELGIPILVLAQLNRETREDQPPTLANIRDTGSAEEHPSNVLFLWQRPLPEGAMPMYDAWEDISVIVAKQRNGPAGLRVEMQFKKNWGAFTDR